MVEGATMIRLFATKWCYPTGSSSGVPIEWQGIDEDGTVWTLYAC